MKAQVIEGNKKPFKKTPIDAITLDIIESALRNARFEMDATVFRTAMSPGIREQHDAFPLIANKDGKMVVGQFGSFIGGFLAGYDGTIEEGDVFFTNDPYKVEGAISHANDWLIILPIYYAHRLVAWSCHFGHMTDNGGKVPGSMPTDATTIFEEGLVTPPTKLYKKGVLQANVLEVMLNQVRLPTWNRSDLNAVLAACRVAERRVHEMCERFGDDVFVGACQAALDRNKRAMAGLIQQAVSETPVSFEDYVDDDGRGYGPYKIKCTMWREGEMVILDWQGTDPQAIGSINFYLNENMLKMFWGIYMIMVFDPQILFNDGFYDLLDVRIPKGTLLKPNFPAALSCRTHALGRIFDTFAALLGQKTPEFLCAAGFSSSPHFMYSGHDKKGEWYQLYQIGFGGIPAKPFGDGPDGHSMWPSFTNVPQEYLEAYFPLRIERHETVADTGGAGKFRGGNALRVDYCFLEDGEISIHDDRWLTYPWGVNGGTPGARSVKILYRGGYGTGKLEYHLSKCDNVKVKAGDILAFITWGGGGWGWGIDRDAELVAADVRRGLVTVDGAKRYGVVLNADGETVNAAETQKLRDQIRATLPAKAPVFDKGPPMAEILANAEKETHIPAPRPPVFRPGAEHAKAAE
ncbi:MAG: hydantoinase B/oxoprolinase family protein [Alphaproteobacteria bacterium]|nr:hydantoinase B/oxoprolinase family protein [Alphaproteobacteria bacterium]